MGDEMQKVKWILAAGFVFLVSAFFSFNELRYLIWGKTVETRVQEKRIVENTSRRGGKVEQLRVAYQFEDAGNRRSEYDMLPTDWPVPDEGNIAVQYIPGDPGSSRLAGHWSRMWVVDLPPEHRRAGLLHLPPGPRGERADPAEAGCGPEINRDVSTDL